MQIETLYTYFKESSGICTDTRKITNGCLFFALKGENFDGNKFAQEALDMGALKVIIDDIQYHKNTGETILCENSLKTLQELATFHREQLNTPIIAITGSNGKTTTKELVHAVLSQRFKTTATIGNLNNHIGVPLSLLSMTLETEFGIIEMGANHLKEISVLCDIALPDYGYITNFGKAHLEGFGSIEGVIQGKTELYSYLKHHGKKAFVNGRDKTQILNSETLERITFGNEQNDCEVQLIDASSRLTVNYKGLSIQSQLIGEYNFDNIAAAIAIGDYFKVPPENIKQAIESYVPQNNRSQLIEKNSNSIILDAYNANPTSMLAALKNFYQASGKEKILFLGDMFELGHEAEQEHQNIVTFLEENHIGNVYLVGSNFFKITISASYISKYESFNTLKEHLKTNSIKNKYILIKASRGMAMERIIDLI